MALGDGFPRYLAVRMPDSTRAVMASDDYDPLTMRPWDGAARAVEAPADG